METKTKLNEKKNYRQRIELQTLT